MAKKFRYVLDGRALFAALLLLLLSATVALAVWLPRALAPAAALERVLSLCVAHRVFVSALPCESKTGRLLLLLLLPWLGAVICLAVKPEASLPAPAERSDGTLQGAVSALAKSGCGLAGCAAEQAEYFPTGAEMGRRLIEDLRGAKKEILLDYYILARGEFFDEILSVLEQKTQHGLQVRLIYDDFGCAATLPKRFPEELRARGIQTTVFHPARSMSPRKFNRRDHRKIAVIDREIAYTGGVNLSDEYIGKTIRFGHWKDTAVRVTGEAAKRFAALYFFEEDLSPSREKGSPCVVFGDGAERGARVGEEILARVMHTARRTLYVCTPYLAPTEKIFDALCCAARAGVDVRVLIPHIPDKKSVFMLTRDNARRLARAGVRVREYAAGFLHAKSVASDGEYAIVGSYNLDARSLRIQAECGVFLADRSFCADVERDFCACWETGLPVPRARRAERVFCYFFRLMTSWL